MPTAIFIGGYGRSGSTLLDLLLGELEDVVAVGEVAKFWTDGMHHDRLCACGSRISGCPFWSAVKEELSLRLEGDPKDIAEIQRSVVRLRRTPQILVRQLRTPSYTGRLDRYKEATTSLFESISAVAGADTIVDSSKGYPHGFVLHEAQDIEFKLIHLVRDGRAVANSWRKRKERQDVPVSEGLPRLSIPRSGLRWTLYNSGIEVLKKEGAQSCQVKYEDLAMDPQVTLEQIDSALSLGAESLSIFDDDRCVPLGPHHGLSGNPLRFGTDELVIRRDDDWKIRMNAREKILATVCQFPLLRRYGYT